MITTETPLGLHGLDPGRPGLLAADDGAALRARARARRGEARRGRPARRRHRALHRPLAEGQVRRPRARLRGADLVGDGQPAARRGALRRPAREGRRATSSAQDLYVVDAFAGADPAHRIARARRHRAARTTRCSRRRCSSSRPRDELEDFEPEALVLHAPAVEADPDEDGTRTGTFVVLHPTPPRGADRRHVLRAARSRSRSSRS